jgi:endonuclease/exonuclease/phosphatase family metal-dependent hydrolase
MMSETGELRVASANLQYGGFGTDASTARLDKTVAALHQLRPRVVLLQELTGLPPVPVDAPSWDMPLADRDRMAAESAARAHDAARRHLRHIAARLGMTPVLGPPVPGQWRRMHTAILVREEDGIAITGTGPPPMAVPGAENPPWTQAAITVEGAAHPFVFYSLHLPARAAGLQLPHAQRLANLIAQDGRHSHLAGDANGIPRTDRPDEDSLAAMNPHLRPARMILDDGPLRPDYSVDDTFTGTGLVDIAASLPPGSRVPAGLLPTGPAGSRVDRHYATAALAETAIGYRQLVTGGSDHHLTMTAYDRALLAMAVPPGPRD